MKENDQFNIYPNFRFNANGWDLNRNFPDYFEDNLRYTRRALEVQHTIEWMNQIPFILSAQFHDGSLLANYPYENYLGGGIDIDQNFWY